MPQEPNLIQLRMDRKRQEQMENKSLIGSVAKTIEGRNSTPRRRSTYYIIGDYLYNSGGRKYNHGEGHALHLECISFSGQCKGMVHIDADTLKVLRFRQMHSCPRDPDLKFQIQVENEMKKLAETTTDSLKDIYKKVCIKNPVIGKRIEYKNIWHALQNRRKMMLKA